MRRKHDEQSVYRKRDIMYFHLLFLLYYLFPQFCILVTAIERAPLAFLKHSLSRFLRLEFVMYDKNTGHNKGDCWYGDEHNRFNHHLSDSFQYNKRNFCPSNSKFPPQLDALSLKSIVIDIAFVKRHSSLFIRYIN